jgi:hypothetical protein
MAVRVLLMLAAFAVLSGCGQASSTAEKQEKKRGVEQAAEGGQKTTTPTGTEHIPIAGVVGENVDGGSFDFRVLDYFVTDHYHYRTDPYLGNAQDTFSKAGKFVIVNYSVTNTGPQTANPNPIGQLHVRAGDKTEIYEETEEVTPPHHLTPGLPMEDLPPRQMRVSQLIFDVPSDVEPELVAVRTQPTIDTIEEVGVVDLTASDPLGPRPEEIVALLYEYSNMTNWEGEYALYSQSSKDKVPLEQYKATLKQDVSMSVTDYVFPSVEVEGDHATIEFVMTYSTPEESDLQLKTTLEAVLEAEGWRVVMLDEQVEHFLGADS